MSVRVCTFYILWEERKYKIMFKELIKSIFSANSQILGLSITPEGGVEGVLFDAKTKSVTGYANVLNLNFNPVSKTIDDEDELSEAIEKIKTDLNLNQQGAIPTVLNLPSYYFGFIDGDMGAFASEQVLKDRLLVEVEQSYMFKQLAPIISHQEMNSSLTNRARVGFCAVRKDLVSKIKYVLSSYGLDVIAVENSYSSIIKTIEYFDLAQQEMNSHSYWGVICVNQNSYSIFSFMGDNLSDVFEDPIAIKTFEKSEVNYAVASVINSNLRYYNFDSIIVVNNSQDIVANELINNLQGGFKIRAIENNGRRQEDPFFRIGGRIPHDKLAQISLFAIGAAVYTLKDNFILKFDLNDDEVYEVGSGSAQTVNISGVPVELNSKNMAILAMLVTLPIVLILFLLGYGAQMYNAETDKKISDCLQKIKNLKARIQEQENRCIEQEVTIAYNPTNAIKEIMKSNQYNKNTYNALSVNVPKNIWLTYYYNNFDRATLIRGRSRSTDDIYKFLVSVKSTIDENNIQLTKMVTSDKNDGSYEFEFSNEEFLKIVDFLKKNDEEKNKSKDKEKAKEAKNKRYVNGYLPILPVSENATLSPLAQDEAEYIKKDMEEFRNVTLQELEDISDFSIERYKNKLPPT